MFGDQRSQFWIFDDDGVDRQACLKADFVECAQVCRVGDGDRNSVAAFYSQREELAHKTIALANIKPVNKSLSEVVHDSWPDNPHMYATIHNLALKVVTGKNAKQLKTTFDVTDAKEALNSSQLEHLERVKELMKQLILNGYSYQEIKATVLKERGAVNA